MSSQEWKDIGKSISHSLKNAIDTLDFTELNNSIEKTVRATTNMINDKVQQYTNSPQDNNLEEKYNLKAITKIENGAKRKLTMCRWARNVGGFLTAIFLVLDVIFLISMGRYASAAILGTLLFMIPGLILLIGGIAGMGSADKILKYMKRFHLFTSVIGDREMASIASLSKIIPQTDTLTITDLKEMIADRFFLQGHINEKRQTFYVTNAAYQASLLPNTPNSATEKEKEDLPLPNEVQEVIREGEEAIAKIREYNDLIPDPYVTNKLSSLENNIRHILSYLEEHPENVEDTKNMTKYYLPSLDKLLETYVELNNYPNPGSNIQKSKKEIEDTLDTLDFAFARLYDDLFQMTSMEVASDISVLETLLAREGLTKDTLRNK